jgi:hypothetical protein
VKLTLTVSGLAECKQALAGFSARRMNAAAATALTRTAVEVRDGIRKQLPTTFDRPTNFVGQQLTLKAATAAQPVAEVGFRDRVDDVLLHHAKAGTRRQKPFELALTRAGYMPAGRFAVPGAGAPLDQHGNMSRKLIGEILSHLSAHGGARAKRNFSTQRRLRNAQKRAGAKYFVSDGKGLAAGIWRQGLTDRKPVPILLFVRPPTYRARFDFDAMARHIAQRRLGPNFDRAFNESAARLAARG